MSKIVTANVVFGVPDQNQINISDLPSLLHKNQKFDLMYINHRHRPYINNNCKFVNVDNSYLTVQFQHKTKSIPVKQVCHVIIDNTLHELW